MNRNQKIALIVISILTFITALIESYQIESSKYQDELPVYMTSQSWKRDGGGDTETIYFTKEGEFGYYCACGSPVDYYDLCDSYKYDQETKTIKLKCSPGVDVTKLKIVSVTDKKLILDFEGEKREFLTEYSHLIDNPLEFAGIKFKTQSKKEEIEIEFTKYGYFEAYNKTKEGFALGSEVCFTWEYDKENNEISLDCQDHTRTIEIKKYDATKKELELYFKKEKKTYTFIESKDNQ
jgi:hypothetical protein